MPLPSCYPSAKTSQGYIDPDLHLGAVHSNISSSSSSSFQPLVLFPSPPRHPSPLSQFLAIKGDTQSGAETPTSQPAAADAPHQRRRAVIPVENITPGWDLLKWKPWSGVLAKSNIWKIPEYDNIAILNADSIPFIRVDGIFTRPATTIQRTESNSMPDGEGGGCDSHALLDQPGAFDPNYPEQDLLNCALQVDG
ncbi:hypothetical protein BJY00DRAFT_318610 [Aspergillus carlsbadensis]|nr:hypothetical protein BJY00DRAFT_318610 [Aspergillus carlsbadensis]